MNNNATILPILRIDLRDQPAAVFLVLLSFLPLFLIGFLLDILLVHFYSLTKASSAGLGALPLWVFDHLAGYRFLPQEIMVGFWLFMILLLILNAITATDTRQFQSRFIYSFLYLWGLVLTAVSGLLVACALPYDLLSARPETITGFGWAIHALLMVELAMIPLLPAAVYWQKKRKAGKPAGTA